MSDREGGKSRLGAAVVPVIIGLGLFSAAVLRGFFKGSRLGDIAKRYPDLHALRRRLLGQKRPVVEAMLGAPRTCAIAQDKVKDGASAATWYYVLGRSDRSAMAVAFADDVVKEVEFFQAGRVGVE